ncbi:Imm21 family immunity protein [Actinomadura sp. 9N215]|uniref:Imm21 family immunity protein n=1 Tax=Actinomadura sp. 9N215 TaxID=3375150 RepID=UPI00378D90C1
MDWVESGGGPLLLAPASQLAQWGGVDDDDGPVETWGDYGRACAVEGYIGLVSVGSLDGLVLGDEPAMTTYLPDERLILRWSAADSEAELVAAAKKAAPTAPWEEHLTWDVDGPVVLIDSAWPGSSPEPGNHLLVDLAPSRYTVRAAYVEDGSNWMILVHLTP